MGRGAVGEGCGRVEVRRFIFILGALVALGFCFLCGLVIGLVAGNSEAYHRRYLEERAVIAPIVADDPAFARVSVEELSSGGIYLVGEVSTPEDLERLRGRVEQAIGELRVRDAMRAVDVRR
jgi:hypothetical protein